MTQATYAVIGAGMAGISCARRLAATGSSVRVLERARGPGGRMATRRFEAASFDHGAQYFTVRDAGFAALIAEAGLSGAVERWMPTWPGGEQETTELWVGSPVMSALPRFLAESLDIDYGVRVVRLERKSATWLLHDDRGQIQGPFDRVVLAMPAPAAAALAAGHSSSAELVAAVLMAPCWAVMLALAEPLVGVVDADWRDDEVLPWIARNRSKPGRTGLETWVLHASAEYSRRQFEAGAALIQREMTERFAQRVGITLPEIILADTQRWRHARVEQPLGEPFLLDQSASLGFCGDWCLDARVEAAYLSGDALATAWLG